MFAKIGLFVLLLTLYIFLDPFPNYSLTLQILAVSALYLLVAQEVWVYLPFVFPFVYFSILIDLSLDSFLGMLLALLPTAVFFPPLLISIWGCPPLPSVSIRERCEEIARRASFFHPDIREWTIVPNMTTAALVGIFPYFRYILFSKRILAILPPDCIEAVFAHEIGHSKHFHPLWLPFILSGVLLPLAFAVPSLPFWIAYFLFAALYIRFIFGFYSRLFEREADLFSLKVGIPITSMVQALDLLGIHSGQTHQKPSWRHSSLAARIAFLKEVESHPELAKSHTNRVRFWQLIYAACFILILGVYFYD